jgi:Holliday junction DNA helicase RuvA
MIAHLRGTVAERGVDAAVIDVGGVGYAVTLTSAAMRALPKVGESVTLSTYTHGSADSPWQLFGFADPDERAVFEALLAVQGVGPRVAVAILSGLPVGELVRAISGGDVARLTQIRGVGRKIAERLTVELRDKIGAVVGVGRETAAGPSAPSIVPPGRLGEVHGALMALGYRPVEFEALLPKMDPGQLTADLIKQALAALRRK